MEKIDYRIIAFFLIALFIVSFTGYSQESEKGKLTISQIDTSIWKYLKAEDRTKWQISEEDSLKAYKEFLVPGYRLYQQIRKISDNKRLPEEEKNNKMLPLLEQSQEFFEGALRLFPFDKRTRDFLKFTYTYLDRIYGKKKNDNKQFEVLLKRLILESERTKRYHIYYSFASLYLSHAQYPEAIANCDSAIKLIFEVDELAEQDTIYLANLLYVKGVSYYQLNDGERALQAFSRAKTIASGDLLKSVNNYIKSISWDDGNIASLQLLYKARQFYKEKDYERAAEFYTQLLNTAKSERVRRLAHHSLGQLEFYQLNKREDGLTRFWIMKNILMALPDTGAAIDSTRNAFLKDYADMCFIMASKYEKSDRRKAFFYFYQLTSFENIHRPRSYYFLANLTTNNIDICLDYCKKAYQTWDTLDQKDKRNLALIFYSTYWNRGEFDEAIEWYKRYYQLQQANNKP